MWLEIDVGALVGNLVAIRQRVGPGTAVWPVVKADGYGHGLEVAARAFLAAGAEGVCVATLDEALALRAADIEGAVLILYPVPADTAEDAARRGFQLAVSTPEGAAELADRWVGSGAAGRGARLWVHLEIETGLTRMGIAPAETAAVMERLSVPGLTVAAIWSHLATPDDPRASRDQERRLADAVGTAGLGARSAPASHLAATGGLLTGRGLGQAMVRPGLIAYGVTPASDAPPFPGMRPAMRLAGTRDAHRDGAGRDARGVRRHLGRCPRVAHRDAAGGLRRRVRPLAVGCAGAGPRPPGAGRRSGGDGRADGRCHRRAGASDRPTSSCSWGRRARHPSRPWNWRDCAPPSPGRS